MANEPNYSSNPSKDEPKKEKVRVIPLEYIDEFPGHPFRVLDDESKAEERIAEGNVCWGDFEITDSTAEEVRKEKVRDGGDR